MSDEETTAKGRIVAMFFRFLALLLIVGALYLSTEAIFIIVFLFVIVVPFEKLFPRHKGQKIRRPKLDTDIGYALAAPLLGLATGLVAIVIAILSLAWIPGRLIRPYVEQIPEQYMPIIGLLLFDSLVYWTHRFYHEIPV